MRRIEDRVFDRFNSIFEDKLSLPVGRREQFEIASQEFRGLCGFDAYGNYESYKTARHRRRSRK